jgi:uncharacterized membrane protein YkvA (DUF1232 family)
VAEPRQPLSAKKVAAKKVVPANRSAEKLGAVPKEAAPRKSAGSTAEAKASASARKKTTRAAKKSSGTRSSKRAASNSANAARAASASKSRFFLKSMSRSRRLLKDNDGLLHLAADADNLSQKFKSGPLSKLVTELKALLRLIRAYGKGDYREVSWESMVLIVAAVVYVVAPIDLIPDFVPVTGFADDAAVLAFVLALVRGELDAFVKWEARPGQ